MFFQPCVLHMRVHSVHKNKKPRYNIIKQVILVHILVLV